MRRLVTSVQVNVAAIFAAFFAVGTAGAQTPAPATPTTPIVLKAARLFDATNGTMHTNGVVVVQGDKITAVGSGAAIPPGARVIDLGDATLLPGFIDSHTHVTDEFDPNYYHGVYNDLMRFQSEKTLYAARWAKRTLDAGFTTIRNVGATDHIDVGLRNAINDDVTVGPRILTAVYSIGSTGGHCDQAPFDPATIAPVGTIQGVCNGPEECRESVRQQMKWGADVIKICASGGVLSESDPVDVPQLTPAELSAIMGEAHTWKRKVAAHAHGDLAARQAIEAGVDSIEHGTFLTESTLKLMKQKGVYLVPTRIAVYWVNKSADTYPPKIAAKARAAWAAHGEMFKTALRVGVPIAFGTDAGVYPHGMNAMEFGLMTDLGMSPSAALLSATREASKLLGVDAESGTLEVGKFADVVAVPGDVIANIRATEHPVFVMRHGQVVVQKSGTP
ncbi:MAG TPA: amidohydrolase family protein [Steroidobacteraceae bacterium]|nr:amidohydrolase family protein [Steroidobacteraceae bacterium]